MNDYKIVVGVFNNIRKGIKIPVAPLGKKYNFKCDSNINVKKNDLCVVETHEDNFNLIRVIDVLENSFENAEAVNLATKWVVDVVNISAYEKRVNLIRKREWLETQLEERAKIIDLNKIALYEKIAETDPETKRLFKEFKELKEL